MNRIALLRRAPRARDEHGAALVELVLILPLLVLLAFGTIEFGAAWSNKLKVETAARAGARVGSSLGKDATADWGLLQSVRSAIQEIGTGNVEYVVVYNATGTSNGAVPAACKTSPPSSQNNLCNVYTGAQLASLASTFADSGFGCGAAAPDRFWCPTDREVIQHQEPDYLGVWIIANSPTVTSIFGSPLGLQSTAVMRLEPA